MSSVRRPRLLSWLLAGIACSAIASAAPSPASADIFGPIELVSAGALGETAPQQAEYAHDSVISANGQFLVFDGAVGGQTGVWRVELATRQIQQVAGGDALLPSVSADGRYVSFTTNQSAEQLAAHTRGLANEAPAEEASASPGPESVFVRDMDLPPTAEGAFTLASAVNGSSEALTYAEAGTDRGSVAAGGAAISADGQEVAFVTTAISNLAGPATPADQVAVRRIDARETILVSGQFDAATGQTTDVPVSGEGLGATIGSQAFPTQAPEYSDWLNERPPGAAISADGSTVAWMGDNVGSQARFLPGEAPKPAYTEPLWRRIAAPATPTMRITGGSDPEDPACIGSGELALPEGGSTAGDPCQGPFVTRPEESPNEEGGFGTGIWSGHGEETGLRYQEQFVPRLSADGYTVAFLSRAEPVGLGEFFNPKRVRGEQADLYVADMHEGLTRDAALTPITRIGSTLESESDPITEFALSESGQQVAFTTRRTKFRLGFPALVSASAAEPGLNELFYADLVNGTLTRVTRGYENGEASEQPHAQKQHEVEDAYYEHVTAGATSPSFADGGELLAFSSTASNLAPYDGNGPTSFSERELGPRDGSDAFVVARKTPSPLPTPQYVSPAPSTETEPEWTMGATAVARRDGSVALYVRLPGAGMLTVSARGTILTRRRLPRRGARAVRATVQARTLLSERMATGSASFEPITIVIRPEKQYAALVGRGGGLPATVLLSFAASSHPLLTQSLPVTFLRVRSRRSTARRRTAIRGGRR